MSDKDIASQAEIEHLRRIFVEQYMIENRNETVEVPKNLLFLISQFLKATSHLLDEGRVPYPSMQWSTSALSHLLKEYAPFNKKVGGEEYHVYDLLHEVNTLNGKDIDLESINKLIKTGQKISDWRDEK